ncbi:hypothetical protein F1643_15650 [Azospirillum sp. INR13]|uniref:hypothetical protein n=1 Tax=Azospirillum sp. INR13 TaxID=2596919 RepID=UPI00189211DD|nr:hypothetical protein [Azospirillum sp. INR13]MBF5095653.1 hypothetical protein [Azospirillum sp. INR13]
MVEVHAAAAAAAHLQGEAAVVGGNQQRRADSQQMAQAVRKEVPVVRVEQFLRVVEHQQRQPAARVAHMFPEGDQEGREVGADAVHDGTVAEHRQDLRASLLRRLYPEQLPADQLVDHLAGKRARDYIGRYSTDCPSRSNGRCTMRCGRRRKGSFSGFYTADPLAGGRGVYLVFWFGATARRHRHRRGS